MNRLLLAIVLLCLAVPASAQFEPPPLPLGAAKDVSVDGLEGLLTTISGAFPADGTVFNSGSTLGVPILLRRDDSTIGVSADCANGDLCTPAMTAVGSFPVSYVHPTTGALQLLATDVTLGSTTYTEATSTGPGMFVRNDTLDSLANTTNEFTALSVNSSGALYTSPTAGTSGGATPVAHISVGSSEDEHAVCTGPCNVYSITVTNTNAATRYLKCENDTTGNTAPGSETPEFRIAVPATGGASLTYPVGKFFSTALTCWLVTGAADSDVAEVSANELMVNYDIKQ